MVIITTETSKIRWPSLEIMTVRSSVFYLYSMALSLIMKRHHVNFGVNLKRSEAARAAYIKHKYNDPTIMMYYILHNRT